MEPKEIKESYENGNDSFWNLFWICVLDDDYNIIRMTETQCWYQHFQTEDVVIFNKEKHTIH